MSNTERVFVYGTLKRGEARVRFWPRRPQVIEPATVRGELYDLGDYPALIAGDDVVAGEVWQFAAADLPETLAVLDRIEGYANRPDDLYRREVIDCSTPAGTVSAWTYRYARLDRPQPSQRIAPDLDGLCRWSRPNAPVE
jgi:gamma-glutamylcyclotransferase (GGCT)/AIG2-like uncharacterized protein YtfP